jgi:hypothetical protein
MWASVLNCSASNSSLTAPTIQHSTDAPPRRPRVLFSQELTEQNRGACRRAAASQRHETWGRLSAPHQWWDGDSYGTTNSPNRLQAGATAGMSGKPVAVATLHKHATARMRWWLACGAHGTEKERLWPCGRTSNCWLGDWRRDSC